MTLQAQRDAGLTHLQFEQLSVTVSTVPETGNLYLVDRDDDLSLHMFTSWPLLPQNFNLTHSVTMQRFR